MAPQRARDRFEHEVLRSVHKMAIRASNGELQGPELESAILDLMWRVMEKNEKRGNVLGVAS